jgi:hypothetical protein
MATSDEPEAFATDGALLERWAGLRNEVDRDRVEMLE